MFDWIERNAMALLVSVLIVLAVACSVLGDGTKPPTLQPQCRISGIYNEDKCLLKFALPDNPVLNTLKDDTEWFLVGTLCEGEYLILISETFVEDLVVVLCVYASPVGPVPVAMNLEDLSKEPGSRYVQGWWYGEDDKNCPREVSKSEIQYLLNTHIQNRGTSI